MVRSPDFGNNFVSLDDRRVKDLALGTSILMLT